MSESSLKHRMISGVFWMAATKASGQAISWVITVVVLRLLAPQDYGLMGMAMLFSGFLLLLNDLGIGAAIIQKPDLDDDQLSDMRLLILGVNLALFGVLEAGAPLIAQYFSEPGLVSVVRVTAVTFIFNGFGAPSGYVLQRHMAFRKKATAEFAGNITGALTTLGMAMSGFGVWSLVTGMVMQQLVINACFCAFEPPVFRRIFSRGHLREFAGFGSKVAMSRVSWYVSSNADFMVVGRMLGSVPLGYYSMAFQFSSLPIEKLVTIVSEVAYPSFSSIQHDPARLGAYFLKVVSVVALLTFPMFIGLMLVSQDAVTVLLTARWQSAVVPLQLLCVVSCFRAIETINAPFVLAMGKPSLLMQNSILLAIVMPGAFYLGARYGGLNGVALSWLLVRPILFLIVTARSLQASLGLPAYLRNLTHPVGASLAMVVGVVGLQRGVLADSDPLLRLLLSCATGVIVYLAYHAAFDRQSLRDALDFVRRRPKALAPDSSLAEARP